MFIKAADAQIRKGSNMEVANYITRDTSRSFSLGLVSLHGRHPITRNRISDRGYLILEGQARVMVGQQTADLSPGDVVFIPAGTLHNIEGEIRYAVINSPPFDPANEESQ